MIASLLQPISSSSSKLSVIWGMTLSDYQSDRDGSTYSFIEVLPSFYAVVPRKQLAQDNTAYTQDYREVTTDLGR